MTESRNRWLIVAVASVSAILVLVVVLLIALRPTVVPDVTLKTVAEAAVALEQAGLVLGEESQVATASIGAGLVAEQQPAPDASAPSRSSVDVRIAVAPIPSEVPGVAGQDASSAEAVLSEALFLPVRVDVFGVEEQQGTVVEQVPAANANWMTGLPVAIAIAAGPDDGTGVEVPDLTGTTLDAAVALLDERSLESRGLMRDVSAAKANVVVDQLPEGGVIVRPGATVLIYLELP